ncbi:BspA family leucine-rich repeat surface protein [Flavobacterium defluvii]|uniref:Surface protein n=1 Tax=Flavobacterium defluvii TaxID=370979 RepID=A0A1M5RN11_9FLAO|nr:BspA family leucine-rich repeat surface protein [Flavobacterium defluvii]SHH27478.1 surface protein [Flavobacterium defluvii]
MGSLLQNTIFGRNKNSFISTWRTSNTSTGSSTSTQIKLPLLAAGTYNFIVDWGDGTSNNITVWNQTQTTHNYTVAGDYIIKITGICKGWQFNNTGDRLKILSVSNWGKFNPGDVVAHFYGCANLTLDSVKDVLDLTGVKTFVNSFRGCSSASSIARINEWNTSSITTMANCFNSSAFNSEISNWDVSKVTDFSGMFMSSAFNQPLNTWNTISATTFANMFQNQFNQNIGNWNVSNCTSFYQMFNFNSAFNNGGSPDINNWTLKTTGSVNLGNMFTAATSFNQPIGNWNTIAVTSTYGMFTSAASYNKPLPWNLENNTSMENMFQNASNFNQNIGTWNVSKVTNFTNAFAGAIAFNNGGSSDINNWVLNSTSNITLNSMFNNAKNFNQPIGNWNTGMVTNMSSMFQLATNFNQNVGTWNTGNVTTLSNMFNSSYAFNQNIGVWNVSKVTNFSSMFQNAVSFNNGGSSDINNWVLNNNSTITLSSMFLGAVNFNQPIGNWNTGNVTNFSSMFQNASLFNQNIGSWNVSKGDAFNSMFNTASVFNNGGSNTINNWSFKNTGTINMAQFFGNAKLFNQPIGNWNVINVNWMNSMFQNATVFNQDISSWNVSNVTLFQGMFLNASAFNQNIGFWDVSNAQNMSDMFSYATTFNQNIGSWNVSNVTNFTGFMTGKTSATFSSSNLDAIYNGWSSRPVKPFLTITFGTAKYTSASSAGKAILTTGPNNWVITDGGI